MARHDEKSEPGRLPDAELNKLKALIDSPYFQHLQQLKKLIKSKVVVASMAGHSGYLLHFEDGSWVLCALVDDKLDWKLGQGEPTSKDLAAMHNSNYQDGRKPLRVDIPYADEECIISKATIQTHGKPVRSVAVGENDFSICFPEGWELEAHVITKTDGPILRIYWEKWR